MASLVGIDLGTTYSVIAHFDDFGRVEVCRDDGGDNLIPSCVALDKGDWSVGVPAKRAWVTDPNNVTEKAAARFKRDMGSTSKTWTLDGTEYSATDLSRRLLEHLKRIADKQMLSTGTTVVTIPANFSMEARQATLDAARLAGLKVDFILNEPTAAALYYAYCKKLPGDGHYAVYDLGGGTFDVSVVKVEGQKVDVVVSNGIHRLGGMDFDNKLFEIIKGKLEAELGQSLEDDNLLHEGCDYLRIEELKKSLSTRTSETLFFRGKMVEVSRTEYEAAIDSFISQTEMCCEATLDEAGLSPSQLSGVLLAGGSTRTPLVRQSIREVFGQDPLVVVNVDEVVAQGAAVYAALRNKERLNKAQAEATSSIGLQEVTNKYYGTDAYMRDESTGKPYLGNSILLEKGEQIPCKRKGDYYTAHDNQTLVACKVTECAFPEKDLSLVKMLREREMTLPPNRPAGQKIRVTYRYDANQILHCTFKDVESDEEEYVSINIAGKSEN